MASTDLVLFKAFLKAFSEGGDPVVTSSIYSLDLLSTVHLVSKSSWVSPTYDVAKCFQFISRIIWWNW